jgi:hypothetical protein
MSVGSSFRERSREESMSSALALEAQRMVRDAAQPSPGDTVKSQRRRAARALGYGDGSWRIRSAWYGEAASWSATAFEELRRKYAAWKERQSKSAEAELAKLAELYSAMAGRLEVSDAEFHGQTIDQLIRLARQIGAKTD